VAHSPAPAVSALAPPTTTLPPEAQVAGSPAPSPAPAGGAAAPLLYLASIALAEVAIRAGYPTFGVAVYGVSLIASINRGAMTTGPVRVLHLGIALVTVGRLLGITTTPEALGTLYYLLIAVPVPIGMFLLARLVRRTDGDLGLSVDLRIVLLSLALIPFGLLLGYLYQIIGRPLMAWAEVAATSFLAPALLAAWAGVVEEVLFRGLLQGTAIRRLGVLPGVVYVAALYTVVVAGPWTIPGIAFAFATAVWLGALRIYTGSVVPAAVAHASLNTGLLFLAWFLQGRV
jgi:membrane protease YdiL (CAAX protease family)